MYPVRREVSFSSTDFNLMNHVFSENDDLLLAESVVDVH